MGAAFVVDHRTVAFSKTGSRKYQMGVFHNRCALMINHHHQRRFSQRSIHAGSGSVTMQIVFQHHHRVGASGFQFGQRFFKRTATHNAQPHAVDGTGNHGDTNVSAATFQGFRDVSRSLNHLYATGVRPGDNQRFLRTCQCLHDDVDFALQLRFDTVNRWRRVIQRMGDGKT
ncbi:Uncharacterised protein [Shigella sonnei]|nr:Uncharacterised protein [Shigella sonnei]